MDFVYLYKHSTSESDELRWSIRSIVENYVGDYRIMIAGDRPPWYCGPCLDIVPTKGRFADCAKKALIAANSNQVNEEFCFMMDDIVFLQSFDDQLLRIPRADKPRPFNHKDSQWQFRCKVTLDQFENPHKYSTHLPHVYESTKIKWLARNRQILTGRWILADLYGNLYYEDPLPASDIRWFLKKPLSYDDLESVRQIETKPVMVYTFKAWNHHLRMWLSKQFPNQSVYESMSPDEYATQADHWAENRYRMKKSMNLKTRFSNYMECEFRGSIIEQIQGRRCGYRGQQNVYSCEKYGKAALGNIGVPGVKACNHCPVTLQKMGIDDIEDKNGQNQLIT